MLGGGGRGALRDLTGCHQLAQTLPCLLPPQVSRHPKIMSSSFAANINPSESTGRPCPENKTARGDDVNWLLIPVARLLSLSRSLPAKWVSRQVCVCIISASSHNFVMVKNGGLVYGASKPNIEKRMWGIIDTSKRDGEYIMERLHLPSPPLTACFSPLSPREAMPRRILSGEREHWSSHLMLYRVFFSPSMFNLIPCAVCYVNCNALLWKFGTGWSLFLFVMSLLPVVDRKTAKMLMNKMRQIWRHESFPLCSGHERLAWQ